MVFFFPHNRASLSRTPHIHGWKLAYYSLSPPFGTYNGLLNHHSPICLARYLNFYDPNRNCLWKSSFSLSSHNVPYLLHIHLNSTKCSLLSFRLHSHVYFTWKALHISLPDPVSTHPSACSSEVGSIYWGHNPQILVARESFYSFTFLHG